MCCKACHKKECTQEIWLVRVSKLLVLRLWKVRQRKREREREEQGGCCEPEIVAQGTELPTLPRLHP